MLSISLCNSIPFWFPRIFGQKNEQTTNLGNCILENLRTIFKIYERTILLLIFNTLHCDNYKNCVIGIYRFLEVLLEKNYNDNQYHDRID